MDEGNIIVWCVVIVYGGGDVCVVLFANDVLVLFEFYWMIGGLI